MNKKKNISIVLLVAILSLIIYLLSSVSSNKKPLVFKSESGGCGNVFVYKVNEDNTVGISVNARKEELKLSTTKKTFEIENTQDLKIEIIQGQNIKSFYCTDLIGKSRISKEFVAKSGTVTISISEIDESKQKWEGNYTTTIILNNVRFFDKEGNISDIVIDELIFKDIPVGWLPG